MKKRMKKLILIGIVLFFYSCRQSNDQFFVSEEIYNIVLQNVKDENLKDKRLKFFYVFSRQDTLIILATSKENEIFPIDRINKLGAFNYQNNKIIVAESSHPKYNIVKINNALNNALINDKKAKGSFDEDIQYGSIYKMTTPTTINLIKKGNLKEFFTK
ncbi:conserved hypothetical protein [Chryseobacterium sp. 8AT]|nr:conserved hypothetical protein [Chryseobacterium sp. 8AT]